MLHSCQSYMQGQPSHEKRENWLACVWERTSVEMRSESDVKVWLCLWLRVVILSKRTTHTGVFGCWPCFATPYCDGAVDAAMDLAATTVASFSLKTSWKTCGEPQHIYEPNNHFNECGSLPFALTWDDRQPNIPVSRVGLRLRVGTHSVQTL